jgi:alkylation response protein AidB-like acyl-CoA dehydrogenase
MEPSRLLERDDHVRNHGALFPFEVGRVIGFRVLLSVEDSLGDADYLVTVEGVCRLVSSHASAVDREARFPAESVEALRAAGLLGLISSRDVSGRGEGIKAAALVVERVARECASTAMILCMHYSGVAIIEKFGADDVRRDIAEGRHLSTLAFSEAGSRSQFWAPVSQARREGDCIRLDAKKSWITSANHATAYVWSSRPLDGTQPSTLWLVPRATPGISADRPFDGLGLRGNDSAPVTADGALVPESARLGVDGGGFALMMEVALPVFNALNAACSVGLMERAVANTAQHVSGVRFEHTGTAIADLPTVRAYIARMRLKTDMARALWLDTLEALESGRPDAMLRVLEVKAACGEAAIEVTDTAMRVCGGAAFRNEVGVERQFRDARAGAVMAPTTDVLLEFLGKAVCGLPLF